jgi:hypothetical protein
MCIQLTVVSRPKCRQGMRLLVPAYKSVRNVTTRHHALSGNRHVAIASVMACVLANNRLLSASMRDNRTNRVWHPFLRKTPVIVPNELSVGGAPRWLIAVCSEPVDCN